MGKTSYEVNTQEQSCKQVCLTFLSSGEPLHFHTLNGYDSIKIPRFAVNIEPEYDGLNIPSVLCKVI